MKLYSMVTITTILTLAFSCHRASYKVSHPLYEFEEAKLNTYNELERSIIRLTCSAFYENFYYKPPSQFSDESVPQESLLIQKKFTTNSVAGTGLLISQSANKILILSCYHVFNFEDTVKTYYLDKHQKITKFLQSLAKKFGQTIYITHKNGTISQGTLIASDENNDIALIETESTGNALFEIPFQGIFNHDSKVKLGQEVYLLGFPKGHFMITRGLASQSKYKNKFIVDASFNRGFSGGIVITFDNRTGDYQYLGMANSTAYDSEITLGPSETISNLETYQSVPYEEAIFIKELKMINYGITFILSGDVIADFLKKEEERLGKLGYSNISRLMR